MMVFPRSCAWWIRRLYSQKVGNGVSAQGGFPASLSLRFPLLKMLPRRGWVLRRPFHSFEETLKVNKDLMKRIEKERRRRQDLSHMYDSFPLPAPPCSSDCGVRSEKKLEQKVDHPPSKKKGSNLIYFPKWTRVAGSFLVPLCRYRICSVHIDCHRRRLRTKMQAIEEKRIRRRETGKEINRKEKQIVKPKGEEMKKYQETQKQLKLSHGWWSLLADRKDAGDKKEKQQTDDCGLEYKRIYERRGNTRNKGSNKTRKEKLKNRCRADQRDQKTHCLKTKVLSQDEEKKNNADQAAAI